ncbi:hypothetical protein ACS0PU_006702 [Formica fusca]
MRKCYITNDAQCVHVLFACIKRLRLEARSLHSRGRMARERTSKTGIRAAERTNGQPVTKQRETGLVLRHRAACSPSSRLIVRVHLRVNLSRVALEGDSCKWTYF